MADIWVLTQPTESGKRKGFIRADVITSVTGDGNRVRAVRSDTQGVVSLAVGVTLGGRRKSLPSGFHVHFLQILDEAQRENSTRARAIMARWASEQEEWQWVVEDVEGLAPCDF